MSKFALILISGLLIFPYLVAKNNKPDSFKVILPEAKDLEVIPLKCFDEKASVKIKEYASLYETIVNHDSNDSFTPFFGQDHVIFFLNSNFSLFLADEKDDFMKCDKAISILERRISDVRSANEYKHIFKK